jgi:hypothetical protein
MKHPSRYPASPFAQFRSQQELFLPETSATITCSVRKLQPV